jgi:hypothetical protein
MVELPGKFYDPISTNKIVQAVSRISAIYRQALDINEIA